MENGKLKISETLMATRVAFEENRALIVRMTLGFAVLTALSTLLDTAGTAGEAFSYGVMVLFGAAYSGLVTAAICLPGKAEDAADLWTTVKPVLARLIWVTLITVAAILAGVMLLIIPGLIILTLWSVAIQAVVAENRGVFEALARSYQLVSGTAWRVFGFMMIICLLVMLLFALTAVVSAPLGTGAVGKFVSTFLGNLVMSPLAGIAPAVLFNQLSSGPEPATAEADPFSS